MSNETSTSPKRARDQIKIFKLVSGDEVVGLDYGRLDTGETVVYRPTKLLLTQGNSGMVHTLAPFIGSGTDPHVAISPYHIVYVMKPTVEIIDGYCRLLQAAKGWDEFKQQEADVQALAMKAAVEYHEAEYTLTLH